MQEVVSRAEFSRIVGVSRARVTQWIGAGKIHGAALTEDGKVRPALAKAQLDRNIDSMHVAGQGGHTRLGPERAAPPAADRDAPDRDLDASDLLSEQIKTEKLREIRARNRQREEEEATRRGLLVSARDAQAAYARLGSRIVGVLDGGLAEMATDIAAALKVSQRDVLHAMRTSWRRLRESAEQEMRREAVAQPALAEIEVGEVD